MINVIVIPDYIHVTHSYIIFWPSMFYPFNQKKYLLKKYAVLNADIYLFHSEFVSELRS